jgi:hypothetical protein
MRTKDGDLGRYRANFDVRENKVGQWPNSNNQRVYPSSRVFFVAKRVAGLPSRFPLDLHPRLLEHKGGTPFLSQKARPSRGRSCLLMAISAR